VTGLLALCLASALAAEPVSVWHAYRGEEAAALEAAAARFSAEQGIAVETTAVPYGAFDTKVETAIPRGNGPDLLVAAHGSLGKWVGLGLLEGVKGPLSGQPAVAMEAVQLDGVRYGWPLAFKTLLLLYNPDLVAEVPQTTDALIAAARDLTKDGVWGLVYEAGAPYYHAAWMHAFGADALDPVLDSPAHVAAYAFTRRLAVESGIVPRRPTAQLTSQLYNEGKAAFVISGPWFLSDVNRPVVAAPLPTVSEAGAAAQPYLTVESIFLAAGNQGPHARAFAAWLAGPEGALLRQEMGHQAVSATGVPGSGDPVLEAVLAQAKQAVVLPTDPGVVAVWRAQENALDGLLRGDFTAEQAAAQAVKIHGIYARPPPEPASSGLYLLLAVLGTGVLTWFVVRGVRNAELRKRVVAHRSAYLWVAPAAVALAMLVVLPFVLGASVSLFAHTSGDWTFVGIQNFVDVLLSREMGFFSPISFWTTLAVTVLWTVTNVALHVGIGVALALVLREPWVRLRALWRVLLIVPWAVPNYITALIWKTLFHVQYGAINGLLSWVSGSPVELDWFGRFSTAFTANLVTNTWLGFPFMMVVTLGALQAIPKELEEAAEVDGAGGWLRFRCVTWPLLKPALMPAVVLGSVWTFNMFNVIYLVSNGRPGGSTEILVSEAYQWAFSGGNRYGYAAAYAVLIFLVLLIYSRGANRLAGRRVL
jgi:arabinogalactan oligomer/maltooligosaccharide transport system permease protein